MEDHWIWGELERSREEAMCNTIHPDGNPCKPIFDGFSYRCNWTKPTVVYIDLNIVNTPEFLGCTVSEVKAAYGGDIEIVYLNGKEDEGSRSDTP